MIHDTDIHDANNDMIERNCKGDCHEQLSMAIWFNRSHGFAAPPVVQKTSAMTNPGAEIKMAITLVSPLAQQKNGEVFTKFFAKPSYFKAAGGAEIQLPSPCFEGERVQQLRLRLAEALKVPSGQVAMTLDLGMDVNIYPDLVLYAVCICLYQFV